MIAVALLMVAQASSPGTAQRAPTSADMATVLKQQGMSPAGIALIQRDDPATRTILQSLITQGQQLQAEMQAAGAAGDIDRLGRAMRSRDALAARFASTRTDATIRVLRALSPGDRAVLIRGLTGAKR